MRAPDIEVRPRPQCRHGRLVLWASQTGTAEDFATGLADRIDGAHLVNMDDLVLADLAAARDVLVVTSTFGDGGPPDNGADFWRRLDAPDAPALTGIRYAVLGIGDRSYDNFCGHAKSIDTRLAALGATRMLERTECEAYDDEPMYRWADRVAALLDRRRVEHRSPDNRRASRSPAPNPSWRRCPATSC